MWLILACLVLSALSLPRFDRRDAGFLSQVTSPGVTGEYKLGDAKEYVAMTLYFRGEVDASELNAPWTYRPIIPFLASKLPLEAMTAINVINLAFALAAVFFLFALLRRLGVKFPFSIIGCFLFAASFPSFYYTTIGYLDPVLICLLTGGTYFLISRTWAGMTVIILFGAAVKETIVILIGLLAVHMLIEKVLFSRKGFFLAAVSVLFALCYLLARSIIPVDPSVGWAPSYELFLSNISRPRTWLSFLLTFSIPGVLAVTALLRMGAEWYRHRFREGAILASGFIVSIILFCYSIVSAYSDGRFIWTSYPFSIPLSMILLQDYFDYRNRAQKAQQHLEYRTKTFG